MVVKTKRMQMSMMKMLGMKERRLRKRARYQTNNSISLTTAQLSFCNLHTELHKCLCRVAEKVVLLSRYTSSSDNALHPMLLTLHAFAGLHLSIFCQQSKLDTSL